MIGAHGIYRGNDSSVMLTALLRSFSSRSTVGLTGATAIAGLLAIAILWIQSSHTPDDAVFYHYLDKRWIIALFGLGVVLLYLPATVTRFTELEGKAEVTATPSSQKRTSSATAIGCLCALAVGFCLALLDIGPHIPDALVRVWEAHELVHLGPLQRIATGAIPYVEAQTQYGPGHQLVSYLMMRESEFTLRGFRASFFALNLLAEGLWFGLILSTLGWTTGTAAIVLSRLFCPLRLLTFVGWYVEFRWLGPFLVGVPVAFILWSDFRPLARLPLIGILGCFGGLLAWFSQENLMAILATVGLVILAGFGRRRLTFASAGNGFAVFAIWHLLTFVALLAATVGPAHLLDALRLYSHTGSLWLRGLANTPWSPEAWRPEGDVWTPAFYATPYVVLVLGGLAIWAPRDQRPEDERKLGFLLATAAGAACLVPLMLLRSDEPHFLGPATMLPILLVFAVNLLPRLWLRRSNWRAVWGAALAVVLCVIFLFPLGIDRITGRLRPQMEGAWQGAVALADVLGGAPKLAEASEMEQRSGFQMSPGDAPSPMGREQPCYYYFTATCGEVNDLIQDIRDKVGERTVFLDTGPGAVSSPVYFFGNLNVQVSKPELISTIWVQADLRQLRAELQADPPDCVINWGHGTETTWLLQLYQHYSTTPIDKGMIYCRN